MGLRDNIISTAAEQIGYKEGRNNDTKFGKWYGMNNQPWCMMFVSWCADKAGVPKDIIPKLAYVPYCVDFYKKQNRYYKRGTYVPQPGDIIFYGSSSHVGLVEKVSGNKVITIEGNTSAGGNSSNGDGVYRRTRNLNDSWIMGYGSPDYKEDEMPEIKSVSVKNLDNNTYVEVKAVNIGGSNYINMRDLEKLFPVIIDWDGKSPTMKLNYKK